MTSFWIRVKRVALLYATPPLVWFFLIMWLVVKLCLGFASHQIFEIDYAMPTVADSWRWEDLGKIDRPGEMAEQLNDRLEKLKSGELSPRLTALHVGSMFNATVRFSDRPDQPVTLARFLPEHMRALTKYPQLRRLSFAMLYPSDEIVAAFDEIPNLEWIELSLVKVNRKLMEAIGRKTNLKRLTFKHCIFDCDAVPLAGCPNLATLELIEYAEADGSILATLPPQCRVHTLIVGRHGTVDAKRHRESPLEFYMTPGRRVPITDEESDRLASLSTLRRLYLDPAPDDGPSIEEIKKRLVHIAVRPSSFPIWPLFAVVMALVPFLIIVAIKAIMQTAFFSWDYSRLIPGYRNPHLTFGALLVAAAGVAEWRALHQYGVPVAPALAVILGTLAVLVVAAFVQVEVSWNRPRYVRSTSSIGVAMLMGGGPIFLTANREAAAEFVWFLQGHHPGIAYLAIVASTILCFCYLLLPFNRLAVSYQELTGRTPPLGMNHAQWTDYSTALLNRNGKLAYLQPTSLPAWIQPGFAQRGFFQRLALMRRGNWIQARLVVPVSAVIATVVSLITYRILDYFRMDSPIGLLSLESLSNAGLAAVLGTELGLVIAISHWFLRRSLFSFEIMHPVRRSRYAMNLLGCLILDFLPATVIEAAIGTALCCGTGHSQLLLLVLLVIIGRMTVFVAVTYWGLSLRNEIALISLAAMAYLYFAISAAMIIATIGQRFSPAWDGRDAVESIVYSTLLGVTSVLVGSIGIWLTHRRWQNFEFK